MILYYYVKQNPSLAVLIFNLICLKPYVAAGTLAFYKVYTESSGNNHCQKCFTFNKLQIEIFQ